jgi:hypothetical protein
MIRSRRDMRSMRFTSQASLIFSNADERLHDLGAAAAAERCLKPLTFETSLLHHNSPAHP